ncbi:MAG: type II secretion system F family protein [Candidatus Omnitrophica bacterium]|nr:type II secretion system F family protein [Candidatus Omnitrophota bacterium]
MPLFIYKAKKENAETVIGEIQARDAEEAVELVSRLGLLPVSVEEKGAVGVATTGGRVDGHISRRDILAFTSQLVSLLKAAVPLLKSVELLAGKTRNARLARVLADVVQNIRNGKTFSSCLEDHPQVFPPLYVAMARAGEEGGRMREMLAEMADYYRKQEDMAMKLRSALTYPAVMLVVGTGTVLFILTFVLPKIQVLFRDLHNALPLPTLIVLKMSEIVQKGWPVMLLVTAVFALSWQYLSRTTAFRRICGRLIFTLPGARDFALKVEMQRFTRTMSLLLAGGIPILRALALSIPTLANEALKDELRKCQGLIEDGVAFGDTLRDSPLIPDLLPSLIAVGEESGTLSQSLKDIAETYEQEISESTRAISTLLEPVLILVVGVVIAFIVFAMLMPIFQMDIFAR